MALATQRIDLNTYWGGPDKRAAGFATVPTPPTPCETYACSHADHCKLTGNECVAYKAYLKIVDASDLKRKRWLAKAIANPANRRL